MNIFYNANIFAPSHPKASAFAIDQGQFVALGSDSDILNQSLQAEQIINLHGKTIWPGLTDAHVHLQLLADSMAIIDCETDSLGACLKRVEQFAERLPKGAWLRGHGWNHNRWESGYGTAKMLDAVTGDHPAYLTAKSLHASWANSKALSLSGIDEHTSNPPSGIIQKDHSGYPTGILFESGAMKLVELVIPKPTQDEIAENFKILIPELWELGLVGCHDFDGNSCWEALQRLYKENNLSFRIRKNIPFDHFDDFIRGGFKTDAGDDWLNIGCLKLFADGALGPQTAAMKQPYGGSDRYGTLLLSQEEIFEIGKKAVDHGIALSIHAIGDLGNQIVLNAFSQLRDYEKRNQLPHLQHRIEHVQIIDDEDIKRMCDLDIIASVQPIHATSDMEIADKYLGVRSKNAYAYQSMLNHGVKIVCGSDAPVEPINPFYGLHAAVTRRKINGQPGAEGWHPEQRLSLNQALRGFSNYPAEISSRGLRMGKIAQGYKADFIILDQNPHKQDPQNIASMSPCATFIEGECVFKNKNLDLGIS